MKLLSFWPVPPPPPPPPLKWPMAICWGATLCHPSFNQQSQHNHTQVDFKKKALLEWAKPYLARLGWSYQNILLLIILVLVKMMMNWWKYNTRILIILVQGWNQDLKRSVQRGLNHSWKELRCHDLHCRRRKTSSHIWCFLTIVIPPCSSSGVHANADQGAFGIRLLCQLCNGLWGRLGFCKVPSCNKHRLLTPTSFQIWRWSSCSKVLFLPGWTRTLLSRPGFSSHFCILKFQSYTSQRICLNDWLFFWLL